jgi:hypothetical protein
MVCILCSRKCGRFPAGSLSFEGEPFEARIPRPHSSAWGHPWLRRCGLVQPPFYKLFDNFGVRFFVTKGWQGRTILFLLNAKKARRNVSDT